MILVCKFKFQNPIADKQSNHKFTNLMKVVSYMQQKVRFKNNSVGAVEPKHLTHKMQHIINLWQDWLKLHSGQNVALYGAGQHSRWLHKLLSEDFNKMPLVKIIDKNPPQKELFGLPIVPFILEELADIDFIIISSEDFEQEIFYNLSKMVNCDKIGRLYDLTTEHVFLDIYEQNSWESQESISGTGSESKQVSKIQNQLPAVLQRLNTKVMLDLPCGDFNWMQDIDISEISYMGGDIVQKLISDNNDKYQQANLQFFHLDLLHSDLPSADVIFCRDCLVHLSFADISRAIANILRSSAKFLITTSFIERQENSDIRTGSWRPLNLLATPFNFPPPIEIIIEGCTESDNNYKDKALCVWALSDLTDIGLE
jgi:SAM-dependent methyltransferase